MRDSPAIPGRLEDRARAAWTEPPSALLRLLATAYAATAGARNLLYDAGVLAARRAPLPVVSVGGLTAGGAAKTPITADIAERLEAAGVRTAILTHGFEDEMEVHRRLAPRSAVYGGRNRTALARRASADGARVALLDSGFQHRRLHRDVDIVVLDVASLGSPVRRLPAGPYREGLASLARADLIIVVDRPGGEPDARPVDAPGKALTPEHLRLLESDFVPPVRYARVLAGPLVPTNEAARQIHEPAPAVAVAGIMWPEIFFRQVSRRLPSIRETLRLPDHGAIDREVQTRVRELGRGGGAACTLKDAGKLTRALGDDVPIWYVSESIEWEGGEDLPTPVRMALGLVDRRHPPGGGDEGS